MNYTISSRKTDFSFMKKYIEMIFITLICLAYLVLAWRYATLTPDWQVPDEPAHYNYVRQVAETGKIPTIEQGDWNQEYLDALRANKFAPDLLAEFTTTQPAKNEYLFELDLPLEVAHYDITTVQYEDHQPPFYYVLQSGVYSASDGDLEAMRFFSAILGLGAVICAWLIGRLNFPDKPWVSLTVAAIVAFIPQRLAMMSGVNNDALAESLAALVLLLVVYYVLKESIDYRLPLAMGIIVGLVFLTKTTVYYVSGIAGLAILFRWWQDKWMFKFALQQIAWFAIPALALGAIWWVHSVDVYGGTDFLGLARHDEVVVGQLRTEDYIAQQLGGDEVLYRENLLRTTFNSFWGQFGWMAVPMPEKVYEMIRYQLGIMLLGLLVTQIRPKKWQERTTTHYALIGLFGLSIIFVILQFWIYNFTFVQFQGRYLYPALIPMAFLIALGIGAWPEGFISKWRWFGWLTLLPILPLVALAWYAVNAYIVPNL